MSGGRCWSVWQTSQLEQLCPTISVIYTQLGHKCNRLAGAGIGPIAASVHTIMPQSPAIFSNWALWFCCGQTWLCRCSHPQKMSYHCGPTFDGERQVKISFGFTLSLFFQSSRQQVMLLHRKVLSSFHL